MRHTFSILFLAGLFLSLFSCSSPRNFQKKNSLSRAKLWVIKEDGTALFQRWEIKNSPALWQEAPQPLPYLQAYRDSIRQALGQGLFARTLQEQSRQDLSSKADTSGLDGDAQNGYLTHSGTVGKIRKIHFLEAQILDYQAGRYPLFSHPTEFHGFILMDGKEKRVRVYFAASDAPWPPKPQALIPEIQQDLKSGWKLKFHLHNHYEPAEDHYLGVMAPSMADAHYFKMLAEDFGLETALITNGFTTVELARSELGLFQSH